MRYAFQEFIYAAVNLGIGPSHSQSKHPIFRSNNVGNSKQTKRTMTDKCFSEVLVESLEER